MAIKTLLLIPPKYELSYPPLGTPALLGFLRSRGKNASQFDSNHEYARYFMEKIKISPVNRKDEVIRYFALSELQNDVFGQKKANQAYYSDCLEYDFPCRNAPYRDWTDSSYHFGEKLLDSDYLENFLGDKDENTFLQYYIESKLGERIVDQKIDLLGISIIGPSQIIPTLTLAKYLKENFKNAPKIVLGGQWCTLYWKQVKERSDFAKWINYLIRGEGETPLLSLIEYHEGDKQIQDVSNLIYSDSGCWKMTLSHTKEEMRKLPAPDFDGLVLDEYMEFSSRRVGLTYETSRECYWNRCTYCVDLPIPHEGYRVKPAEQVVDELVALKEKYNYDYIIFSDPAMAPSRLKSISEIMIERGLKIPFWCFARLEKNFTREIFDLAKQAGCDELDYGMETSNQRLMDFVDKGTTVSDISRVIKDTAEAGIKVALQVIFRFPTETYEEALETVNFLVEHKKWIHEAAFNIYYLTPGNHIYNDPERFEIEINPGQPTFRFFHLFENKREGTITYDDAYHLMDLYKALTRDEDRVELRKTWLDEWKGPEASEAIASYLDEIAEVLDCELEMNGVKSRTSLAILASGQVIGFMSSDEAEELRKQLESIPNRKKVEAPKDLLPKMKLHNEVKVGSVITT